MYAAVPFYNLPKLQKTLAHDMPPSTGGLFATWRIILCAWKIQRSDPDYAIPIEIPKEETIA